MALGAPRIAPGDEATTTPARDARPVADRAILRACFGPLALGYLVAVCCGAALAWDSGGIFFQLLDTRAPVTPNQRWVNAVAQLPALLASRVTDNLALLGFVFGLTWALVPLGALAAAWLLARRRAPELFVWPVMAVGLGLLPGLFYLGTEADVALVLVWPLFLATLLGVARPLWPVVAVCAILLAISHPYAIGLFALLAALALLLRRREGRHRRELVGWALAFGLLAGLTALRFLLFHTGYERDQLSRGALAWNFLVALRGYPAAALGGTAVAALLALALPHAGTRAARRAARAAQAIALLLVAACLLLWARDPHQWAQANKYGYPALPITLGFLALALLDRARLRAAPAAARRAWGPRLRTIGLGRSGRRAGAERAGRGLVRADAATSPRDRDEPYGVPRDGSARVAARDPAGRVLHPRLRPAPARPDPRAAGPGRERLRRGAIRDGCRAQSVLHARLAGGLVRPGPAPQRPARSAAECRRVRLCADDWLERHGDERSVLVALE